MQVGEADVRATDRPRPRRGDIVRVRSREEILATLAPDGTVGGMPFMPEMLEFAGKRLPVLASAHKTCNTIAETGTTLKLENTVHLTGARCDGSAHGGCQAGCLLFWREEWLERDDEPGVPLREAPTQRGISEGELNKLTYSDSVQSGAAGAAQNAAGGGYRCQATDLLNATAPLRRMELDQFRADLRSRNVGIWKLLLAVLFDTFNRYQSISTRHVPKRLRIAGGASYPFLKPTGTGARVPITGLKVGDLVEVKSKDEIMATLGPNFKNRGMLYDGEMLRYSGRRARVAQVVERIVDEKTGRMIELSDCYVLEDVVCVGLYHRFCPRAITPYWREAWLRRVEESNDVAAG
jgi:hypothetical protein